MKTYIFALIQFVKRYIINWRQFITIILVSIALFALIYCLVKITHTLLTKPISTSHPSKPSYNQHNQKFNQNNGFNYKNTFSLKLSEFFPVNDQVGLVENNNYLLIKQLDPEDKQTHCVFGMYKLVKKQAQNLIFYPITSYRNKKIDLYSLHTNKSLSYSILTQNQLTNHIPSCNNWVYFENIYHTHLDNIEVEQTLRASFNKPVCKSFASTHIILARSMTPSLVYFTQNPLNFRLEMCLKQAGRGIIQTMDSVSGKMQTSHLIITLSKKHPEASKQDHKSTGRKKKIT